MSYTRICPTGRTACPICTVYVRCVYSVEFTAAQRVAVLSVCVLLASGWPFAVVFVSGSMCSISFSMGCSFSQF